MKKFAVFGAHTQEAMTITYGIDAGKIVFGPSSKALLEAAKPAYKFDNVKDPIAGIACQAIKVIKAIGKYSTCHCQKI